MNRVLLFLFIMSLNSLSAYQSEDKLKALIIGKVAKYIVWDNKHTDFTITILNDKNNFFKKIYHNKKIHGKNIKIDYIDTIDKLNKSDILYISDKDSKILDDILKKVENKNILLVSDIRGFAERGGILQIYFVSQKIKLRINLDNAKKENLKIKSSLLRVADVVRNNI